MDTIARQPCPPSAFAFHIESPCQYRQLVYKSDRSLSVQVRHGTVQPRMLSQSNLVLQNPASMDLGLIGLIQEGLENASPWADATNRSGQSVIRNPGHIRDGGLENLISSFHLW